MQGVYHSLKRFPTMVISMAKIRYGWNVKKGWSEDKKDVDFGSNI